MSFLDPDDRHKFQSQVVNKGEIKNGKISFKDSKRNPKTVAQYLGTFLSVNGFKPTGEKDCWSNDMCGVVITETNIEVANNNGDVMYSPDHNIYWLVGMLTWYGYIPKNYFKDNQVS